MNKIKNINYRIDELNTAIRALKYAARDFNNTKDNAYLLTLKGTLRALVAMGGKNMAPLLIELSEELSIPLEFYSFPPIDNQFPSKLPVYGYCCQTWSVTPKENMIRYNLKEWLKSPAYLIDTVQEFRSRNQILKHLSNKEGGSHYDKVIVDVVDYLSRFKGTNFNGIQMFLMDMGSLTHWLGTRLTLIHECRSEGSDENINEKIKNIDRVFDSLNFSMI
jgi:hypothetical protein